MWPEAPQRVLPARCVPRCGGACHRAVQPQRRSRPDHSYCTAPSVGGTSLPKCYATYSGTHQVTETISYNRKCGFRRLPWRGSAKAAHRSLSHGMLMPVLNMVVVLPCSAASGHSSYLPAPHVEQMQSVFAWDVNSCRQCGRRWRNAETQMAQGNGRVPVRADACFAAHVRGLVLIWRRTHVDGQQLPGLAVCGDGACEVEGLAGGVLGEVVDDTPPWCVIPGEGSRRIISDTAWCSLLQSRDGGRPQLCIAMDSRTSGAGARAAVWPV